MKSHTPNISLDTKYVSQETQNHKLRKHITKFQSIVKLR